MRSRDGMWTAPGTPVIYDHAPINVGGGYSTTTGVFTAPIAGTYKMQVYGLTIRSNDLSVDLKCNGAYVFVVYTKGPSDYMAAMAAGNAGYVRLLQGQTCQVVGRSASYLLSAGSGGANANSFSGHLVHLD